MGRHVALAGLLAAVALAATAGCGSSEPSAGSPAQLPVPVDPTTATPSPVTSGSPAPSSPADGGGAACTNPVRTSAAPAGQVQSLGTHAVGSTVSFTVPPGTISVTIVEQAIQAPATISYSPSSGAQSFALDNTAVPLRIRDARGVVVFDDLAATPTDPAALEALTALFASNSPGTGTLTMPNTTAGLALLGSSGLPSGSWSAVVSDWAYECTLPVGGGASCSAGSAASTYDVTVLTRQATGGAIPAAGAVDVAVYFATTTADTPRGVSPLPLTAATANAGNDPDLNRMAQTLELLLGRAAIAVSSLTYVDLPAAVQASVATGVNIDDTGTCSELAGLLRQSGAGNAINVFFVSSFISTTDTGAAKVVGIDGSIPGPATFGGTNESGAAVATHDLRAGRSNCRGPAPVLGGSSGAVCGADVTAYIIAHEVGHFLGLYHDTESDGLGFDPLHDTPTCACGACNQTSEPCSTATSSPSNAHQMTVAECTRSATCGGGDNLMFWLLDSGSTGSLSDEQQRVMRASAAVR